MGWEVVTPQQLEKYITYKKGSSWKVNHKELCKLGEAGEYFLLAYSMGVWSQHNV
jgi:hypothetical protein